MENLKSKITYHQEGDYLIPDLILPNDKNNYQIGKYGYLRLNYLRQHKRGLYCELNLKNELNKHLIDIDKESNKKISIIINQLAKKENISLYYDGKGSLSWIQKINNIKNRAEEIVLNECIYC